MRGPGASRCSTRRSVAGRWMGSRREHARPPGPCSAARLATRAPVSCAPVNPNQTFVLIHGAWHGAWCWHKLTPLLEGSGARVIAPDLGALGSFEECAQLISEILEREPG